MKSNMTGLNDEYKKMYEDIKNWTEFPPPTQFIDGEHINEKGHYICYAEHSIADAPYFGWSGERLKNEINILDNVKNKYIELKKTLEEAIGIK